MTSSTSSPKDSISLNFSDPMSYREAVESELFVAMVEVSPKGAVGVFLKALRGRMYCHRGVRNVIDIPQSDAKGILLDPAAVPSSCDSVESLPDVVREVLELARKSSNTSAVQLRVTPRFRVRLTFKCFTMPELLKKILPDGVVPLSGFEQVGHIAHVNLSAAHIPFQFIIGQIILDTNVTVKTVVNKVDSISSVFREFKMDVIAGEPQLTATVKQHGFLFEVPYDRVYWNSRLGDEHTRLVSMMRQGDELFDVMAGIGPFAIPAAAAGVKVHANDLNPASVAAMRRNMELNGISSSNLTTYEMDGRAFIHHVLRGAHLETSQLSDKCRRHVSMNLPALAVKFLDAFTGPLWKTGRVIDRQPLVHCYTFSAAEDVKADAVSQVEAVLGTSLEGSIELVHNVRDVAPTKQMVCVSFRLPLALTEAAATAPVNGSSPSKKRQRDD